MAPAAEYGALIICTVVRGHTREAAGRAIGTRLPEGRISVARRVATARARIGRRGVRRGSRVRRCDDGPLTHVPYADLCPGNKALAELMDDYR